MPLHRFPAAYSTNPSPRPTAARGSAEARIALKQSHFQRTLSDVERSLVGIDTVEPKRTAGAAR